MGSRKNRKLRNFLINNDIQLRLVFTNMLYLLLIVVATMAMVLSPLYHDMFMSTDLETQFTAARTFLIVTKRLIPSVIIMFVMIFLHQILITHRICGPLVNFTKTFKKVARGDLTRKVRLRQGDHLKQECEKINEMIDGLSDLLNQSKADQEKLVALLEQILGRVKDIETKKQVKSALGIVLQQAQSVSEDLSRFEIDLQTDRPTNHGNMSGARDKT